jgi:hypothetical protein
VPGPARLDVGQPGDRRQRVDADVAQVRHAERGRGGERLAPPIDVAAADVLVRDARVDHHQLRPGRPRNPLEGDRARVDEQRLAGTPQAARHLVHDPDRRADEVGLDALRQPGDRVIVDRERLQRAQPAHQADAQGGARRHAAADGDRRDDPRVEALDLDAVAAQHVRHALDVVDPALAGLLVAQRVGGGIAAQRGAERADTATIAVAQPHVRPLRQHRRQDEAVVVVGVLADQVDPGRCVRLGVGRGTEGPHERLVHRPLRHEIASRMSTVNGLQLPGALFGQRVRAG